MLNLCLVVISSHFAETKERELTKMKLERRENCSASVADTELMSKSIYTQIIQYFVHLYRLSRQQLLKFYRAKIVHFSKNRRDNTTIEEDQLKSLNINPSCAKHGNLVRQALIENPKVVLRFNEQQTANYTTSATPAMSQQREQSSPTGKLMFLEKFLKNYFISFFFNNFPETTKDVGLPLFQFEGNDCRCEEQQERGRDERNDQTQVPSYRSRIPKWCTHNQTRIKTMVDHKHFQNAMLAAILINTLSMGIEYHNQVLIFSKKF